MSVSPEWPPPGGIVAFVRDRLAEGWSEDRIEAELRARRHQPPLKPVQRDYHDVDNARDADEDQP